jgi:hypothetical protein
MDDMDKVALAVPADNLNLAVRPTDRWAQAAPHFRTTPRASLSLRNPAKRG